MNHPLRPRKMLHGLRQRTRQSVKSNGCSMTWRRDDKMPISMWPQVHGSWTSIASASKAVKTARPTIRAVDGRSEEHTSELQSLMRLSYAVFCLKNKTHHNTHTPTH